MFHRALNKSRYMAITIIFFLILYFVSDRQKQPPEVLQPEVFIKKEPLA